VCQLQLPAADTENGFGGGPVFLDWRRGRFAGAGGPGHFYENSQGFVTGFPAFGLRARPVGADQDDILVAGFERSSSFSAVWKARRWS